MQEVSPTMFVVKAAPVRAVGHQRRRHGRGATQEDMPAPGSGIKAGSALAIIAQKATGCGAAEGATKAGGLTAGAVLRSSPWAQSVSFARRSRPPPLSPSARQPMRCLGNWQAGTCGRFCFTTRPGRRARAPEPTPLPRTSRRTSTSGACCCPIPLLHQRAALLTRAPLGNRGAIATRRRRFSEACPCLGWSRWAARLCLHVCHRVHLDARADARQACWGEEEAQTAAHAARAARSTPAAAAVRGARAGRARPWRSEDVSGCPRGRAAGGQQPHPGIPAGTQSGTQHRALDKNLPYISPSLPSRCSC
jgi:hypothetical protein